VAVLAPATPVRDFVAGVLCEAFPPACAALFAEAAAPVVGLDPAAGVVFCWPQTTSGVINAGNSNVINPHRTIPMNPIFHTPLSFLLKPSFYSSF
jgi:hypothetical protein